MHSYLSGTYIFNLAYPYGKDEKSDGKADKHESPYGREEDDIEAAEEGKGLLGLLCTSEKS